MSLNKKLSKNTNVKAKIVVESDNESIKEDIIKKDDKIEVVKKNLGGRPKKSEKYKKERVEVLNKLNNILGVTETNKKFYMYDVDNDEAKQKAILDLKNDVEMYFTSKSYNVFVKSDEMQRNYLSLIKLIFKEMNIKLTHTIKTINRNDKSVKSGCYLFDVE
jgi:hypothetical protein